MSKAAERICQREKRGKNRANKRSPPTTPTKPQPSENGTSIVEVVREVTGAPQPQAPSPQAAASPCSTALAVAAKLEERLASSEAHRRSLEQETSDLRRCLQDALHEIQRYDEMQNGASAMSSGAMSPIAIPNPQEWGPSDLDAEKRVAKSQEHLHKKVKHFATGQLARALSNEDDMKRRLARKVAECESLQKETDSLRAALRNALNGTGEIELPCTRLFENRSKAQMQTQGVQTQDVVMPSQDVIEVWDPVPKEWGPSDLEAEKRITRSAQQHSREMRQYATKEIAQALLREDDLKRSLAKSEAQRRRLQQRLEGSSNGDTECDWI